MRRMDREVKDLERITTVIRNCDCCRIGLIDEQGAYIVPVNFGYEEVHGKKLIYFHSAMAGKKVALLEKQEITSFEMDCGHELVVGNTACAHSYHYQCIMGHAKVSEVHNLKDKKYALQLIVSKYSQQPGLLYQDEMIDKVKVFQLEIIDWSCKVNQ